MLMGAMRQPCTLVLCFLSRYVSITQELNAIFDKIDTDHSGKISFDEFVTGVAKFVLEKSPNGATR